MQAKYTSEESLSRDHERRLISDVLEKDRKATAEFVSLCTDTAYPFVRRRLMPRTELVEDLMQEILVAAWKNLANFRAEADLRSWMLGIARHKVEDYYRKKFREADGLDSRTFAFVLSGRSTQRIPSIRPFMGTGSIR